MNAPQPSVVELRPNGFERVGWGLLLAHLFLSPLLFSYDTVESVESVKVALLMMCAITLTALGLCAWMGQGQPVNSLLEFGRQLRRDPICIGVLLFFMSATLSTIWSISPRVSFFGEAVSEGGWLTIAGYAALFFATRWMCRTAEDASALLGVSVVAAAIASTYALAQVAHVDPIAWDNTSNMGAYVRPFATMGHPNFLAAYLVMVLPVLLYLADRAWMNKQWLALTIMAAVGVLACWAIFVTLSRGAWLAMACALTVLALGWLRVGKARRIAGVILAIVILAALGFGIACLLSPRGPELVQNLLRRTRFFTYAASRQHIWSIALKLFHEHPWLGCGVDSFHLAFCGKRGAYWYTEWNTTPLRAHNIGLHLLATQGLVGAFAGAVFMAGLFTSGWRAWRRALPATKPIVVVIGASLVGFLVQNLFSFTVTGLGTLFVALAAILSRVGAPDCQCEDTERAHDAGWKALAGAGAFALVILVRNLSMTDSTQSVATVGALVGMVLVGVAASWAWLRCTGTQAEWNADIEDEPAPAAGWVRPCQFVVGASAVLLCLNVVITPLRASMACRRGDVRLSAAPDLALAEYQSAVELNPEQASYRIKSAAAAVACARKETAPAAKLEWLSLARSENERAIAMVPVNAYYRASLGRTLLELARVGAVSHADVFVAYDIALKLDPQHAYYYSDAANAAIVLNELPRATAYAEHGLMLYPHFGLLQAHLGYVALLEKRYEDGAQILTEALAANWYREEGARRFAKGMLHRAQQQLEISHQAAPVPPHRPPSQAAGSPAAAYE